MGLGIATTEFLVEAVARGARLDRTATIGKQAVFVGPGRLIRLLKRHERWPDGASQRAFFRSFRAEPWVLDPLLRTLGADSIDSIDASDYEGATIVHDLNQPIGADLTERFSFVLDGGSLEHIFNVPVALRSYMEMVEVGGHLMIHTMANNYLGHGFYQFSPELFFRTLVPDNGYEVERVVLVENDIAWRSVLGVTVPFEMARGWYEVRDPAAIRGRVLLQSKRPVVIQVLARRTNRAPIFEATPQQSDYVAMWSEEGDGAGHDGERLIRRIGRSIPPELQMEIALDAIPSVLRPLNPIRFLREARGRSLRNRAWYRRVRR
ncbi:MAG: hypothetical protein ICV69_15945 [Thermoleophilaceae bacterium]|nr:hypothetical protein [Thermoleophilaceae bacterium]